MENESLCNLFRPASYFEFPENHKTSPHVQLPSVSKWSTLRGYTFTVWIRIPFLSFSQHEAFVGCLFDFHSKGSGGCSAMFHYDEGKLRLEYRCSVRSSVDCITSLMKTPTPDTQVLHKIESTKSVDLFLKDDEWHFITVTHSWPYIHKPRLRVYVDGVSRCDKEMAYPNVDVMNQCTSAHGLPSHTRLSALTLYGGVCGVRLVSMQTR